MPRSSVSRSCCLRKRKNEPLNKWHERLRQAPGLPPDFPDSHGELNNCCSERLYGLKHKLPRCRSCAFLAAAHGQRALRSIYGRQGHGARPVARLLYFPFTYEYKDSAMVPALLDRNAPRCGTTRAVGDSAAGSR